MCLVCLREFSDQRPQVLLPCGCGATACNVCIGSLQHCPLCKETLGRRAHTAASPKPGRPSIFRSPPLPLQLQHYAPLGSDVLKDDTQPSALGSCDTPNPARVHMLERAASSGGGSLNGCASSSGGGSSHEHCMAVSARHLAHGGVALTRVLWGHVLLPAAHNSCRAGHAALRASCSAVLRTSQAVAHAACRAARFATAKRVAICNVHGPPPLLLGAGPSEPSGALLNSPGSRSRHQHLDLPFPLLPDQQQQQQQQHQHHQLECPAHASQGQLAILASAHHNGQQQQQQPLAGLLQPQPRGGAPPRSYQPPPPPLLNLSRARITLRACSDTRLRVEYCRDCVVVASGLQRVELLLVGCHGLKLVLRGCADVALRELQCSGMADFVRTRCPGFTHHIVCLRCACQPAGWGAGEGASGSGGAAAGMGAGARESGAGAGAAMGMVGAGSGATWQQGGAAAVRVSGSVTAWGHLQQLQHHSAPWRRQVPQLHRYHEVDEEGEEEGDEPWEAAMEQQEADLEDSMAEVGAALPSAGYPYYR